MMGIFGRIVIGMMFVVVMAVVFAAVMVADAAPIGTGICEGIVMFAQFVGINFVIMLPMGMVPVVVEVIARIVRAINGDQR